MRTLWALACLLPVASWAGTNDLSFQGRLIDATGAPYEGPHRLTVGVYDASTGGELRIERVIESVPFVDGYYSVTLEDISAVDLTSDPWVALSLDDESLGARKPLNAAGRARVAVETFVSSFGKTLANPADSCAQVQQVWDAATDGAYYVRLGRNSEPVQVWCSFSSDGPWLDIVASFHLDDAVDSELSALWFAGGTGTYAVAATNGDGTPGVLVRSSQSPSHQQAFRFQPEIPSSAVRVSWRLQGSDEDYRCSHTNWVPLNGPGYNGGLGSYYAACPSGYSCVQGSPQNYRDAPVAASWSSDSFDTASQLLLWSGSNTGAISRNCSRDPLIPSTEPALFITDLRVRS